MPHHLDSRCALAGVFLLGIGFSANVALGAAQEVAVLRSYEAPGDCPSATAFMDHFASRTQRVRITSNSTAAHLELVVTLSHEDGQVVGKLAMRGRSGVTSHRVVSAQSCDELVPALAFVAALVADPSAQGASSAPASAHVLPTPAQGASSAPASAQGASSASASAHVLPARQVPLASGVAAPAVIAPHRPKDPAAQNPIPHREANEGRWRWSLAAQLGAISGPSPKWSPLGAIFLELGIPRSVWGTRGFVSLGFLGALPVDRETQPGSVKFQWLTAGTAICPVVIGLSDQWSTAPCITGELGLLRGTASGITSPGARTRWWRAAGAAIQLRWAPSERYFLHSEVALTSPLARDEFGIIKEGEFASVHKVLSIVGRVGLGVGLFL